MCCVLAVLYAHRICPNTCLPLRACKTTITRVLIHLDDLPQETQDEVRPGIHDVLGANVDDVAADGGGRVEGQGLVLVDGEGVQLALVDGSLVNGARHRRVDQLAACVCGGGRGKEIKTEEARERDRGIRDEGRQSGRQRK